MIERINYKDLNLATVIRHQFKKEGVEFFTDDESPMQIGYMNRDENYFIKPHVHNEVERKVMNTHEVLYIKSGKVRIDFYTDEQAYIESTVVQEGDVILLADGGHGFKMLEPSEIIEVKQGPYVGELDKIRFDAVEENYVQIREEKI
jgi:hypothetical protein